MPYVLALDQGTTSSRAIAFDHHGGIRALAQRELTQIFPRSGWVEHDPLEIWGSQLAVAMEALGRAQIFSRDVVALGITNQRETTIIWDRQTGQPVSNAIVWQDRRTADFCARLKAEGHEQFIRERTGLVIDPYFSATKIAWILDNVPGARARADAGQLAFGTVDSWLIWQLTTGKVHATDVTNASRTMLFNIHSLSWDQDLLRLFNIPLSMLPEVRSCSEIYGHASSRLGLEGVPIAGIAGDQQAALFGQMCIQHGLTKNTYGTGCFLLQNTGPRPISSANRLLSTVAWKIGSRVDYALEGSIFIAGAVVQWLRDGLGLIRSAPEIEQLAASVPDNGGIYFVPAFSGLGAPHWDPYARGTVVGITRSTTAGHLARAALESIAYQVSDLIEATRADSGLPVQELRVDGGASANDLLMQFQADLLGVPVVRTATTETTALGAAYLAGLATRFWTSLDQIATQWRAERRFQPTMPPAQAHLLRSRWANAISCSRAWGQSDRQKP